ncbi:baseplate wedge subunit [Staphylococcus phage Alsa_1]|nr:baseplate wedge subunit [Staphylococcus phage Alsa_1]WNM56034.1 baseplate wedge subunit [Staphylococcus phage S-CoN_Ph38]
MRTKKFSEILSRLIDKTMIGTRKVNDFTPGSVIRSLYEAVALEIEQYYMLTRENIKFGIEQGVMDAFDFKKRQPKRAYGTVTIKFYNPLQEDLYIPRGTTFTSTRQRYVQQFENIEDYYVPQGSMEYDIEVYCKQAGTVGNVPENTIDTMGTSTTLINSVTNKLSFSTGSDEESMTDLKNRFHLFVESRGRATGKAIEYGARQVEEVQGVYVKEDVGHITVYAHDKNGDLPESLQTDIEYSIEDYRPSGIALTVRPVQKQIVDLDIDVTLSDIYKQSETLQVHIENVVRAYLNAFNVSQDLIISDLIQIIMNIDDYLIYDCSITNISGNIDIQANEILRAGNINVNFV